MVPLRKTLALQDGTIIPVPKALLFDKYLGKAFVVKDLKEPCERENGVPLQS